MAEHVLVRQLKALHKSVDKWGRIVSIIESGADRVTEKGSDDCACCKEFLKGGCRECPIFLKTGYPVCQRTPYEKWDKESEGFKIPPNHNVVLVTPANRKRLLSKAKAELKFLEKLEFAYECKADILIDKLAKLI